MGDDQLAEGPLGHHLSRLASPVNSHRKLGVNGGGGSELHQALKLSADVLLQLTFRTVHLEQAEGQGDIALR